MGGGEGRQVRRRCAGLGLALALTPTAARAQGPDVTVRLYRLQQISHVQVSAPDKRASLTCPRCEPRFLEQPATVRLQDGRLQVDGKPWPGAAVEIRDAVRLAAPGHGAVELAYPLTIRAAAGGLQLMVRLPLEDYVAGVLAGESSGFTAEESLKAMAVAARSYAVSHRGRHQREGFDFCDTTHCQDLRLSATTARLRDAAEATAGELLWHEGRVAAAFYHGDCGGATAAAREAWPDVRAPYLTSHPDPYCVARGQREWRSEIALADLQQALAAGNVRAPAALAAVEVASRTASGRVEKLRLSGETTVVVRAEALRLAVGRALGWEKIRSDLYEVRGTGSGVLFHGRGAGHGVGLCQTGAAEMGGQGRGYREILAFYYPGTAMGVTAQGLPWQSRSGERIELLTTEPAPDEALITTAERLLREAESLAGWRLVARPRLRAYPTVEVYRNATGLPGWVAAGTLGRTIRLQPMQKLRATGKLEETLRHELLHLLIEERAGRQLPLWFREGLTLALAARQPQAPSAAASLTSPSLWDLELSLRNAASEESLRRAYHQARLVVEALIRERGREEVLRWVQRGIPADVLRRP